MPAFRRPATRLVAAVSVVAAVSWVAPAGFAGACSCEEQYPTVADSVGRADIAFVGSLDVVQELDPPLVDDSDRYDVRYELIVEHAVKGVELGDRVVMFGDIGGGSSCGTSELTSGVDRHAILSSEDDGRFIADSTPPCSALPTIDELLDVDITLPATSAGPVSIVVTGRLGEAELISYAADGRPVAYGNLPRAIGQPVVCPTSQRLIQLEQDRDDVPALVIRKLGTLDVEGRIAVDVSDTDPAADVGFRQFLADGAVLECRSADANDVVGLLPWERSGGGETIVVRVDRESNSFTWSAHGKTSRARHDPGSDHVVGVRDGALVRIDTENGNETLVADLLVRPVESDFDAVFVEPDGAGGWWVGLGDGEYELATNLRVLVHIAADDTFERWEVEPPPEAIYDAGLLGGQLVGDGFALTLPTPGSSDDGTVVTPEVPDSFPQPFTFSDGRSLRFVTDEGSTSVELIAADGEPTTLQHLLQVRYAVTVADGPTVDSDGVDRSLSVPTVDSPWVTPDGEPAFDRASAVDDSAPSTSASADGQLDASADEQPVETAADGITAEEDSGSSGSDRRWIVVVAVTAGVLAAASVAVLGGRRRLGRSA